MSYNVLHISPSLSKVSALVTACFTSNKFQESLGLNERLTWRVSQVEEVIFYIGGWLTIRLVEDLYEFPICASYLGALHIVVSPSHSKFDVFQIYNLHTTRLYLVELKPTRLVITLHALNFAYLKNTIWHSGPRLGLIFVIFYPINLNTLCVVSLFIRDTKLV